MTKSADELFVENGELQVAKIKGAMLKWIRDRDRIRGPEPGKGMAHYYKNFEGWINRKVREDWYSWKNEHSSQDELIEVMEELFNKHDEFNSLLWEKAQPYKGKDKDWENGDGADEDRGCDDEGDGGGSKDKNSHRFPELHDIGAVDENNDPVPAKLMGTMLAWSKKVDTVKGPQENITVDIARESWFNWMFDKFGQEWVQFSMHVVDPTYFKQYFNKMWDDRDEFRDRVKDKYEYDETELEGNGNDDDSYGEGESGPEPVGKKQRPGNGLKGWGEKVGTTDDPRGDFSTSVERSQNGEREAETGVEGNGAPDSKASLSQKQENPEGGNSLETFADDYGTTDTLIDKDAGLETEVIHQGHCVEVMNDMPRSSVDCVITSPPYWGGVRDYEGDVEALWQDGEWQGQLGHEPTPDEYVDNLMEVIGAIERVMKPKGCLFFNIGDVYGGASGGHYDNEDYEGGSIGAGGYREGSDVTASMPEKCLCGVPERFMLRMLDEGWILRNKIRWCKQVIFEDDTVEGSTMPSAAGDRFVEKSVEVMYFFTQKKHYNFDIDPIRRPHKTDPDEATDGNEDFYNEEGANLPVAWQINPKPSRDNHSAPFPDTLLERPIKAGTDKGGIVLDPFAGTGTTCEKAAELSRHYVGIELSDSHWELADKNCPDSIQYTFG